MKINVIQATGQDGSEQTCVWVVGDDGETTHTTYLKGGEQMSIEVGASVTPGAPEGVSAE